MPEKNGGGDTPKTPDTDASIQPPPQPPGNQNPPAPPPDDNSHNNQARITELEQETRGGERWLIGIGIATMVINTGIALIYLGQLLQMRKATRAAALGAYSACLSAQVSRSVLTQTQVAESDAHASAVATVYQAMSATESERAEMQLSLGKPEIRV